MHPFSMRFIVQTTPKTPGANCAASHNMAKFNKQFGIIGIALIPLVIGLMAGLTIPVDFIRSKVASSLEKTESAGHNHDHGDDVGDASNIVQLSELAQENMQLTTGRIKYSDYQSSFEIPAFVREIPAASDLHVASRFTGMVKRVFISEGQTVRPGQPIMEIELTGDLLATAQSELLDARKQMTIVEKELKRLQDITSGGVARNKKLEVQYERDRLLAKIETKMQELLVRGLTEAQVEKIVTTRKLIRLITVRVPDQLVPPQLNAGEIMTKAEKSFVVDRLAVRTGSMAVAGADLCQLAYHAVLAIEGQAYEKDLPEVRASMREGRKISVSIGPDGAEHTIPEKSIAYLSNHVDEETNTYPFYVYLTNEAMFGGDSQYVAWRWKPGQRAHVAVPDKRFEQEIVIPREALAIDGPSYYVFRWEGTVDPHEGHDHGPEEEHDHDDHEMVDEYIAIEVIVKHMDRHYAVIELKGELEIGDRIAINNAAQLLFAMQAGSGGGGGHSHPH